MSIEGSAPGGVSWHAIYSKCLRMLKNPNMAKDDRMLWEARKSVALEKRNAERRRDRAIMDSDKRKTVKEARAALYQEEKRWGLEPPSGDGQNKRWHVAS